MADAQAQTFEQSLKGLGHSLAQWRQWAQYLFEASPDDRWAYDALCMSMLPRISGVDAAVLRADRNLLHICQQLAIAKKKKAHSVESLQTSRPYTYRPMSYPAGNGGSGRSLGSQSVQTLHAGGPVPQVESPQGMHRVSQPVLASLYPRYCTLP